MQPPCLGQRREPDLRFRQSLRGSQSREADRRAQAVLKWLSASFESETFVEKSRVIELGSADQLNGVMAPLAHASDPGDSHGKEDESFNPFGALCNPFGVKDTFRSAIFAGKNLQNIIGHQFIRNRLGEVPSRNQTLDLVPPGIQPYPE